MESNLIEFVHLELQNFFVELHCYLLYVLFENLLRFIFAIRKRSNAEVKCGTINVRFDLI